MADYESLKRGQVTLPLATGTGRTLLQDADPAIFFALEYFRYVLNKTIGPALIEHGGFAGMTFTSAVAHAITVDPRPHLAQQFGEFPMLAVYRQRGKLSDETLSLRHNECAIVVEYILPPLTAGQAEVLVPILHAASVALDAWCVQGFDPAYTPTGGALAGRPFGEAHGGVEHIELTEPSWGLYPGLTPLPFYALVMQGVIKELDGEVPDLEDYGGADVSLGVQDPTDGSEVADVVEIATQLAPTFTSIAPATAAVAGGTSLVITGTLFKSPVRVWIAGEEVAATVTDTTHIACASPPVEDYLAGSAFDIEIECDGQSVTAADALTFTA